MIVPQATEKRCFPSFINVFVLTLLNELNSRQVDVLMIVVGGISSLK